MHIEGGTSLLSGGPEHEARILFSNPLRRNSLPTKDTLLDPFPHAKFDYQEEDNLLTEDKIAGPKCPLYRGSTAHSY